MIVLANLNKDFFMNRTYRVIFNQATGAYQCVAEFAKAKGKTKSVKALAVATSLVMGAQAMAADIEFKDGKTTTVTNSAGLNGDVIITNPNTKLVISNQAGFGTSYGSTPKTTNAIISNKATLQAGRSTAISEVNDATVTVDDATLSGGELVALGIRSGVNGKLIGKNGASIAVQGRLSIGNEFGATGEVELDGSATTLTVTPNANSTSTIRVGERGTGVLTVKNQASVTAKQTGVGSDATGVGTMTMTDSKLTGSDLAVGLSGKGTLNADGSKIELEQNFVIADKANSVGSATLKNTSLGSGSLISVGGGGKGSLNFDSTRQRYPKWSSTKHSYANHRAAYWRSW